MALWIKNNPNNPGRQIASSSRRLNVAGSDPGSGQADNSIRVVVSINKGEEERHRERDAGVEAMQQHNTLPDWIKRSTVSGHFAASELAENTTPEATATPSSNDESLRVRGLGAAGLTKADKSKLHIVGGTRPVICGDAIGGFHLEFRRLDLRMLMRPTD